MEQQQQQSAAQQATQALAEHEAAATAALLLRISDKEVRMGEVWSARLHAAPLSLLPGVSPGGMS